MHNICCRSQAPSLCPLAQREWQNELRDRVKDGSLAMPEALTRF